MIILLPKALGPEHCDPGPHEGQYPYPTQQVELGLQSLGVYQCKVLCDWNLERKNCSDSCVLGAQRPNSRVEMTCFDLVHRRLGRFHC